MIQISVRKEKRLVKCLPAVYYMRKLKEHSTGVQEDNFVFISISDTVTFEWTEWSCSC